MAYYLILLHGTAWWWDDARLDGIVSYLSSSAHQNCHVLICIRWCLPSLLSTSGREINDSACTFITYDAIRFTIGRILSCFISTLPIFFLSLNYRVREANPLSWINHSDESIKTCSILHPKQIATKPGVFAHDIDEYTVSKFGICILRI